MSESPQLTDKQAAFVLNYSANANATQAAIAAGYSKHSAGDAGARLLKHSGIAAALQARRREGLARLEVTEARCLQELASIAFSNVKAFSKWSPGGELEVLGSEDIPDDLAACIESVTEKVNRSENKDGTRKYININRTVKLYAKLPALQLICEYLGMTDSMAPKLTVRLITGINRTPPPPGPPQQVEQHQAEQVEAIDVEAEQLESSDTNRGDNPT